MSEDELFREFSKPEKACSICRVSSSVKLVTRQERVGCLISPVTYCRPCAKKQDEEDRTRQYQRSHFCNKCGEKFKRPHSKNVKHLNQGFGFLSYSILLCIDCFDTEIARNPSKPQEDEDLWSYSESDSSLW